MKTSTKVSKEKTKKTSKATKVSKDATKGEYILKIEIGGNTFETDTDNIEETILSYAQPLLKTSVTIWLTKGDRTEMRYLYLPNAKKLFANKYFRASFIKGIMLPFN